MVHLRNLIVLTVFLLLGVRIVSVTLVPYYVFDLLEIVMRVVFGFVPVAMLLRILLYGLISRA